MPDTTHQLSYNGADASLAVINAAAVRRKSSWRIPSSARQLRASHNGSSARYPCNFANNGYACCSLGGSQLCTLPSM